MNVLLVTFGSSGDVNPIIGLGLALQRAGMEATVMTNGFFEAEVRSAGLEFVSVSTADEYESIAACSDLWHPRRGLARVADAWVQLLSPTYEAIRDHYVPGRTVVAASGQSFGARVAQEHLGVPLATVQMQPAVFRSLYDTPRLPIGPSTEWQPRWIKRLVYRLADWFLDRELAAPVNAFRRQFQLPPVRRVMADWWLSPQRVIGLFPDWFGAPQPDWPPHSLLSGFPLYDGATDGSLPAEAEQFLDGGEPPVVFTAGTAMRHGETFFRAAVEACGLLARRGLLLTGYSQQLPTNLPRAVRAFDYLPFGPLLPRCAAIVHHGGIGTTSQSLAAGIPQLIMPMAFDQPDNAARAERLGVARVLAPRAFRAPAVASALEQLIDQPPVAAACRRWAPRCTDPQRLDIACEAIRELI
jgi:rhamnosyltransferase subunit B